jgi:hypothetical protein
VAARKKATKKSTASRPRARRKKSTPDLGPAFLDEFRRTRCVTAAAEIVGRSVSCFYKRRERDEAFREEWDAIVTERNETLKGVMIKHAIEGTPSRPIVVYDTIEVQDEEGNVVRRDRKPRTIDVVEFDSPLQRYLAASFMPDEFGKRANEEREEERDKAATLAAMVAAMAGSVPEWIEGDAED